ncbi:MAG: serine/threonine-protein kinase [bacterium]
MPRSFRGYEIQGKLGAGGMSTLYLGIQTALNRKVAIKMLHPGLADDENFISRFEREAKTASAIGHRNIVSVFDFGVEDDVYYIVMELVQGTDLKDALTKTGRIPPEVVLAILEEVSYGLEAAHEQGVIHRDMKPSNVMLSNSGEVKVADFGLARQSSDISRLSALTLPGSVLGTPAYMSPEQAAGKDCDHRTDIYSLGVMAYELLTGEKPFRGSTYSEIRDQIINHDPPALNRRAPVTPEIEQLVEKMLAKDPDKRFASMRHVIRAIEDCMETLDPTGGLIKHRRKYLGEFAQDPVGFSEKLRSNSISAHLDRGFYFKQMGLAKIDDAAREFRYVLFLDPENSKANDALHDLEKQAEESGVRLPARGAPKDPSAASAATAPSLAGAPVGVAQSDSRTSSRTATRPSVLGGADKTRVLGGEAAVGTTQVFGGEKAKGRGLGVPLWIPIVAVVALGAAFAAWKLKPGGGPPGAIALSTQPPGAAVFVRGPKDPEFRPTGLVTNCRMAKLGDGAWEVRVELAGYVPQVRRVEIAGDQKALSLALVAAAQDGRFALVTTPDGASVWVRTPGQGEFRALAGKTPLTSEPLAAGNWEVRAEAAGVGRMTRTVAVPAGGLANVKWDLTKEHDVGRVDVTSDPPGASIRVRRRGDADFVRTPKVTPAALDDLAAGDWEIRVEKAGFAEQVLPVAVDRDAPARLAFTLTKGGGTPATPETPTPPGTGPPASPGAAGRDGYASIIVVPFADVYVDGRLFQNQARRAVIPLSSGKTHLVELRHPTFGTRAFKGVKAAPGDTTDLGKYVFKWGQVRVYCKPSVPSDLLIDGRPSERQTPYSDKITTGEHRFAVRKAGYHVKEVVVSDPEGGERHLTASAQGEVTVDVPADKEVRIQFVLAKEGG